MEKITHEYNYLMEITNIISKNVKTARERAGITQKTLAEKCGVTTHQIGEIEAGRRKPSIDLLFSLAIALGIATPELLNNDEELPLVTREPVSKLIAKLTAIPDKVYDLAQEISPNDKVAWEDVEIALEAAIERNKLKELRKS